MATTPFTLPLLRAELDAFPAFYGALTDYEVQLALAAIPSLHPDAPFTIDARSVEVSDILDAIEPAAWGALTAAQATNLNTILLGSGGAVRASTNLKATFSAVFSGQTQTNLAGLLDEDGSRGLFLWAYHPTASEVAEARRI